MTAIAAFAAIVAFAAAAAIKAAWAGSADRDAAAAAMAGLGPNLRKEAGLAPDTGSWLR